jgi:hypothetical protein
MNQTTANHNHIDCPNCGHHIDIDEVLHGKFAAEFARKQQEAEQLLAAERRRIQDEGAQREAKLADEWAKVEMLQRDTSKLIEEKAAEQIQLVKQQMEADQQKKTAQEREDFQRKLRAENDEVLQRMKTELDEQAQQIQKLKVASLELEKLKREKDDLELDLKQKFEAEKNEAIRTERAKLMQQAEADAQQKFADYQRQMQEKQEHEDNARKMKDLEKDKKLQDLMAQIEEMKRKAEQGSMQAQGEVQELLIEDELRRMYPFDQIEEVKKGARGADCVWIIRNDRQQVCGKVLIESKNTQNWSDNWVGKLKEDQIKAGAMLAVIVTQALPAGLQRVGLREGVWVSDLPSFGYLTLLLRNQVLAVAQEASKHEGKTDKMSLLYNYLTSDDFHQKMEAVMAGFVEMKQQIDTERRAFEKQWSAREKSLASVLLNLNRFVGDVQGIAGASAIPSARLLGNEPDLLNP